MRKPSFSFAISSSKENDQITSLPHTPLPLLEKFVPLLEIVSITILVCQFYGVLTIYILGFPRPASIQPRHSMYPVEKLIITILIA